ncbi:MAG: hypothetical protein U5L45_24055 [Saprospiraceae bacterium]|nr:hypothetical protein [Saprospiraceae bacterium]
MPLEWFLWQGVFHFFRNYLAHSSLRSREGGEVVGFSGKARKTNHIPLFCERSEL